jgi:hypothetical protein
VIYKILFLIDFLDELELFIEEKPIFTKISAGLPSAVAVCVISWLSK